MHEMLFAPLRQVILSVLYMLLTAQMALIFASFRNGRSGRRRLVCLLPAGLSFALFYLSKLDIDWLRRFPEDTMPVPAILDWFRALPVWLMILYEGLTALIVLAMAWEHFHYRKTHVSARSIKETIDLLPAGIAFGKPDGTVALFNLAMGKISRALTGNALYDLNEFRQAASEQAPDSPKEEPKVTLPDGAVWQVSTEETRVDGKSYTQLTATEITAQAAITRELEAKNEKLRDLHLRLDLYNRQADRIIIAQELLAARMTVHSEVGNVLLESRHYLQDPASFDEEKLLQALKNTNTYLLREYEEDDTVRDPLTDAMEIAEAIGVDVMITGPIPAEAPYRQILANAIGECASNAVKHANGDQLTVEIHDAGAEITFILRTNGKPPKKAIRESGGLRSLRQLVEKEKGTMETASLPTFTLTLRLPKAN